MYKLNWKIRSVIKKIFRRGSTEVPKTPLGPKLNLGCGFDYRSGWDNWELLRSVKAEAYLDFSKDVFPATDGYYAEIYSNGVVEQIPSNGGILNLMNESHRILKMGGIFTIMTPNANYPISFRDPHTHRHFTPETFRYFCKGMKSYERYGKLYGYKPWSALQHTTNERGIMTVILVK